MDISDDAIAEEIRFEDFLNMQEVMTNFQAKITYIGEQRKALPTIVIRSRELAHKNPWESEILKVKVAGIDFGNDDLAPIFCEASGDELVRLTENLSKLPTVTNQVGAARYDGTYFGKYLALSLYNRFDEEEYRLQSVLGQPDAIPLLDAVGQALKNNQQCRDALLILWRGLGFHVGVLGPDSDGDGASDGREASWGTDPRDPDSDGDGIPDGVAILAGDDPLNPFRSFRPDPVFQITEGPFKGSKVVETCTTPDLCNGHATLELTYRPDRSMPKTDNLVFVGVFRRTAIKADGFQIPILPSLYIEYAGSPELDLLTVDGATVDHKVGELDPYYNGRDPQDNFSGASAKQHPGFVREDEIESTAMIYRCRTYEEHWRALNPEGVREIRFDYEAAAFCENGEGKGSFLGVLNWSWGKKRRRPVTAFIRSAETITGQPTGTVVIQDDVHSHRIPVFRYGESGQPSKFFSEVLSLWNKRHKFSWPGPSVQLSNGIAVTAPQPVSVDTRVKMTRATDVPQDELLRRQNISLTSVACDILGMDGEGRPFPDDYFPFGLPLTVTLRYSDDEVVESKKKSLGVVRYDGNAGRYVSTDLYVLQKDPKANLITFCISRFGKYALVQKR